MLRERPLHLAAQASDARELARLIAEGEVVDARNYRMYTPLHIAAGMGASELVAALMAAGADAQASPYSRPHRCTRWPMVESVAAMHGTRSSTASSKPAAR